MQVVSAGGGQVTPDGWSVNTSQPAYQPSGVPPAEGGPLELADPKGSKAAGEPVPPQTAKTIGDTLSAKGVSWAWYAGGWNAALADGRRPASEKRTVIYARGEGSPMFQPHHQPFNYYARFAPGTHGPRRAPQGRRRFRARHRRRHACPRSRFYKPAGRYTQHPSYTDVKSGDEHMADILARLRAGPQWGDMLIVLTYDENGGYWDHAPPPSGPGWGDRWGPGTRIPAILVGPTVKRGFVDHTPYDTTSILKFVTERFGLEPLAGVREKTGDLTGALRP